MQKMKNLVQPQKGNKMKKIRMSALLAAASLMAVRA
jgi:hypothetical protein